MSLVLGLRIAMWGAATIALVWLVDEIGDRREAKVRVEMTAEREREKQAELEAAERAGEEAETARRAALKPGSIARLVKDWCRDCEVGQ